MSKNRRIKKYKRPGVYRINSSNWRVVYTIIDDKTVRMVGYTNRISRSIAAPLGTTYYRKIGKEEEDLRLATLEDKNQVVEWLPRSKWIINVKK